MHEYLTSIDAIEYW